MHFPATTEVFFNHCLKRKKSKALFQTQCKTIKSLWKTLEPSWGFIMEAFAMFIYVLARYWDLDVNSGRERHRVGFETHLNLKPLVKPAKRIVEMLHWILKVFLQRHTQKWFTNYRIWQTKAPPPPIATKPSDQLLSESREFFLIFFHFLFFKKKTNYFFSFYITIPVHTPSSPPIPPTSPAPQPPSTSQRG